MLSCLSQTLSIILSFIAKLKFCFMFSSRLQSEMLLGPSTFNIDPCLQMWSQGFKFLTQETLLLISNLYLTYFYRNKVKFLYFDTFYTDLDFKWVTIVIWWTWNCPTLSKRCNQNLKYWPKPTSIESYMEYEAPIVKLSSCVSKPWDIFWVCLLFQRPIWLKELWEKVWFQYVCLV